MIAMQDIKRYCDAIVAAFKPQKTILFSSDAYGQPTEDSGVEVLGVMPEKKRVRDRDLIIHQFTESLRCWAFSQRLLNFLRAVVAKHRRSLSL